MPIPRLLKRSARRIPAFCRYVCLAVSLVFLWPTPATSANPSDPFSTLRGKWGGNGMMSMRDGRVQRLVCNAEYTGSVSQLRLLIACKSNSGEIDLRARLSANAGKLLGVWEEKTYKALGSISGIATERNIKFYIAGNILGNMNVAYSRSKQVVDINVTGIPLRSVEIKLSRR